MRLEQLAEAWELFRQQAEEGVRVLVVDDEPSICHLLQRLLRDHGYDVVVAENAEVAWDRFKNDSFDLLLIDKNLPGASGLDLINWVTRSGRETPMVLMTSFPSADTVMSALGSGASDYVVKPFDNLGHLVSRLQSIIDGRLTQRLHNKVVEDLMSLLTEGGQDRELVASVASRLASFKQSMEQRAQVLLLEENATVAAVVQQALAEAPLAVEVVGTVPDALAALARKDSPLSVVVGIDHYRDVSVIEQIRGADKQVQVVVTSGSVDLRLALAAVAAGATDYVLRHFEGTQVLRVRVQRAVARGRRHRLYMFLIATLYRAAVEAGYEVDALVSPRGASPPVAAEVSPASAAEGEAALAGLQASAAPPGEEPPTPRMQVAVWPPGATERRAHKRVSAELNVRYLLTSGGADFLYANLKDISAGGMYIAMDTPLPVGSMMSVEIVEPSTQRTVRLLAEVVRRVLPEQPGETHGGVGVRFVGGDKGGLLQLVEALSEQMARPGATT